MIRVEQEQNEQAAQKLKEDMYRRMATQGCEQQTSAPQPDAGCCGQSGADYTKGCDEPSRENLRGRAGNRFRRAHREGQLAERLAELIYMLDKHPEVARILDLLELTGA